jgi:hypothetical protein
MRDRLLNGATVTPPMRRLDRFRRTYIIPGPSGEYGKFLHFENLGRRLDCAIRERRRK